MRAFSGLLTGASRQVLVVSAGLVAVMDLGVTGPMLVLRPERADELRVAGPFDRELVDAAQRGLARERTCVRLGVSGVLFRREAKRADDDRQREPLTDEGREDHGEREQEDEIAVREGHRKRERGRQ